MKVCKAECELIFDLGYLLSMVRQVENTLKNLNIDSVYIEDEIEVVKESLKIIDTQFSGLLDTYYRFKMEEG